MNFDVIIHRDQLLLINVTSNLVNCMYMIGYIAKTIITNRANGTMVCVMVYS